MSAPQLQATQTTLAALRRENEQLQTAASVQPEDFSLDDLREESARLMQEKNGLMHSIAQLNVDNAGIQRDPQVLSPYARLVENAKHEKAKLEEDMKKLDASAKECIRNLETEVSDYEIKPSF